MPSAMRAGNIIDVKKVQIKIKNVKKSKNVTKIKKKTFVNVIKNVTSLSVVQLHA